ncbi:hypothetical protein LNK20_19935, partial [Bacillus safensis]|nr:hypothetical protein [Bacillus safensis]
NLAILDQNVLLLATVGEIGVSHDQIEHRRDLSSGYARTEPKKKGSFLNCLIPYNRWAQCREMPKPNEFGSASFGQARAAIAHFPGVMRQHAGARI